MSVTTTLSLGSNPIWLTFAAHTNSILLQAHLLGLGPDHSLICGLPPSSITDQLTIGLPCKGRSCIDGEIFEFESTIQEIQLTPLTLKLEAPRKISKQQPRLLPRLSISLSGTVRPLSETGQILAVLPVTLINLSPIGCQFQVPVLAWPVISSLNIQLSCRLPGVHHYSRISGTIEWVQPKDDLTMGIRFVFNTGHNGSREDLHHWFSSQKARLINTKV